jgi:hypothetical protein
MEGHELIERFVASFEKLDDLAAWDGYDPGTAQLVAGPPGPYGERYWRPKKVSSEPAQLEPLYAKLPARLPHLFESLILSYRWAEVHLPALTLLANPPGPDLSGLIEGMSKNRAFWAALIPAGYIQFAKGPDMDHDPVCFDIRSRKKNWNYGIVKIDHEKILCNNRIEVVAEIASSFKQLMEQTIERAESVTKSST